MGCRVFLHNLSLYTVGVGRGVGRDGSGRETRKKECWHVVAFVQQPEGLRTPAHTAQEGVKGLSACGQHEKHSQ